MQLLDHLYSQSIYSKTHSIKTWLWSLRLCLYSFQNPLNLTVAFKLKKKYFCTDARCLKKKKKCQYFMLSCSVIWNRSGQGLKINISCMSFTKLYTKTGISCCGLAINKCLHTLNHKKQWDVFNSAMLGIMLKSQIKYIVWNHNTFSEAVLLTK